MKKIFIFLLLIGFIFSPLNIVKADNFKDNGDISQIFQLDVSKLKYDQKQLVYAILMGNEHAVKTILDSDSNPQTTYAKLPLTLYAVYADQLHILKILMDYGFDPNESYIGVSAIDIAIVLKRYEHIEYLLSIGVQPSEEDYEIVKKSKNKRLKELLKVSY